MWGATLARAFGGVLMRWHKRKQWRSRAQLTAPPPLLWGNSSHGGSLVGGGAPIPPRPAGPSGTTHFQGRPRPTAPAACLTCGWPELLGGGVPPSPPCGRICPYEAPNLETAYLETQHSLWDID